MLAVIISFMNLLVFIIPSYCFQSESHDTEGDTDRKTDIKISNDQQAINNLSAGFWIKNQNQKYLSMKMVKP